MCVSLCTIRLLDTYMARYLFFSFFVFKQKAAYEILRDWSSDVCSSDLLKGTRPRLAHRVAGGWLRRVAVSRAAPAAPIARDHALPAPREHERAGENQDQRAAPHHTRSEERRVGKECRSRRSPYH